MRIRGLPSAVRDLDDIWFHIAADNVDAANRLIQRITQATARLTDFPESGSPKDEIVPGLRGIPIGSYVAYYRVEPDYVTIVRVLHAARDPKRAGLDGPA